MDKLNITECKRAIGALPCPFCGDIPFIEPWHGGSENKRMIACHADDCDVAPSVTGDNRTEAIRIWNTRP